MSFSLLFQQLCGYLVASLVTYLTTRYHLTSEQAGMLNTDIMGYVALGVATLFGLWTNHRAYLATPPSAPPPPTPVRPLRKAE